MFDRTPDVPPIEADFNVECGWTANAWNLLSHLISWDLIKLENIWE